MVQQNTRCKNRKIHQTKLYRIDRFFNVFNVVFKLDYKCYFYRGNGFTSWVRNIRVIICQNVTDLLRDLLLTECIFACYRTATFSHNIERIIVINPKSIIGTIIVRVEPFVGVCANKGDTRGKIQRVHEFMH